MSYIRTIGFWIFLFIWTPLIQTSCLPLFIFNKRLASRVTSLAWSSLSLKALKIICKLDYKIIYSDAIPKSPMLIAAKHQSMWETIFLSYHFPHTKFIVKKQLLYIPFYGWYLMLAGMIGIDRNKGLQAMKKVLRSVKKCFENDFNIGIFPEGTRVEPLQSKPYLSGVYAIHKSNKDVPVLAVAHNSGDFWQKGLNTIKPGVIYIKIFEFHSKDFNEELKNLIDRESDLLTNMERNNTR